MSDITWIGAQRHLDLLDLTECNASRVSGFTGSDACGWRGSERLREHDLKVVQEMLCLTSEERQRKTHILFGGVSYLVHVLRCHGCLYELSYRPLRVWEPDRGYWWRIAEDRCDRYLRSLV